MMIKNYKNGLKPLKKLKELELLREEEINEIKNATERKLSVLNDILENSQRFNVYGDEINEKEGLKEEVKNKDDLLNFEIKIFKLLTDLKHKKEDILHEILLNETKLEKLGISETTVNAIKKSFIASKVKTTF